MPEKQITIEDIAKALNMSKTTVSRALSGKGRIGEETRERVVRYAERHSYKPNSIAKSLAEMKTYNIGFVIPKEYAITELSFYQKCLWGISQVATSNNYDVLVTMIADDDISQLNRIVENKKVDGLILGRTSCVNTIEQFLGSKGVPFVTVGSSVDSSVLQVDNDHEGACQDLTYKLIKSGVRKLALIGGDTKYIVNRNRYHGFVKAFENADMKVYEERIFLSCNTTTKIEEAVDRAIEADAECILCMDDDICMKVLNKFHRDGLRIPDDIMVGSFYNSHILKGNPVKITAINFDETKLGEVACRTLLDRFSDVKPIKKVLLGYEISIQESTHKKKHSEL